ncbi:hypothetical protein APB76_10665 [Vibrio bivalvicida]|uniref:Uncharacterized protein n=1 Tax=Vibrio bivalvicida TaxID=1276888 RepID=A0A177Y045_9VIBR|nr:hypothetical protein APB76_10665 [Vibrio bivalvicida]
MITSMGVFGLTITVGIFIICYFKNENKNNSRYLEGLFIIFFHQNKLTKKGRDVQKLVRRILIGSLLVMFGAFGVAHTFGI